MSSMKRHADRTSRVNRQGSALIITILLISVIATVSFSVSALAIAEFRKTANLQDSIAAYYAAESGIEHGLMQYRIWHDAQVSREYYQAVLNDPAQTAVATPMENSGQPQLFRISDIDTDGDGTLEGAGRVADNDPNIKGTAWYGLKMWYKAPAIGNTNPSGDTPQIGPDSRRISRDSALQLSVSGATGIRLAWSPIGPNSQPRSPSGIQYFLEAVETNRLGDLVRSIREKSTTKPLANPDLWVHSFSLSDIETLRIKPWDMEAANYSLVLMKGGTPVPVDAQVTFIESTGQVGTAKRKLKIGIPRSTGTALELEDFLLFSGNSTITIP